MSSKLTIIEETNRYLVVNKPAGIAVERNWDHPSLEAEVMQYLKQTSRREQPFLGIVHRLDRVTSGVVLFAKKKSALRYFNQQFAERSIDKIYWAVVEGEIEEINDYQPLVHYIEKDQQHKRARVFSKTATGRKRAQLAYKTIMQQAGKSLLSIRLLTGRYHQIRAQMAHIGHPVVGDTKYGAKEVDFGDRIMLHARSLSFFADKHAERKNVSGKLPESKEWNKFKYIKKICN